MVVDEVVTEPSSFDVEVDSVLVTPPEASVVSVTVVVLPSVLVVSVLVLVL